MPRNPKPIEQHRRDGTRSRVGVKKRKTPGRAEDAPVLLGGGRLDKAPPPPAHLPADAGQAWTEIVTGANLVLDRADLTVVEGAAVTLALARRALVEIGREGLSDETAKGRSTSSASLRAYLDTARLHLQHADRLGLSPSSRARLGIELAHASKAMREEMKAAVAGDPGDGPAPRPVADVVIEAGDAE